MALLAANKAREKSMHLYVISGYLMHLFSEKITNE